VVTRSALRFSTQHPFTFGVYFEAEHQAQVKLIDVRANRSSSTEKAVQRHRISRRRLTMNEGALTKYFDVVPGKWRINSSVPGFKVVAVALVDLRRRLFPLRQIKLSEFAKQVPFDEKGEPIEPPVMRRGLPTLNNL
jgi:hypothetical protein